MKSYSLLVLWSLILSSSCQPIEPSLEVDEKKGTNQSSNGTSTNGTSTPGGASSGGASLANIDLSTPTPTFQQVQTVIAEGCLGAACHTGSDATGIPLDTLEDLEANFPISILSINGGRMPIGRETFKSQTTEIVPFLQRWQSAGFPE